MSELQNAAPLLDCCLNRCFQPGTRTCWVWGCYSITEWYKTVIAIVPPTCSLQTHGVYQENSNNGNDNDMMMKKRIMMMMW